MNDAEKDKVIRHIIEQVSIHGTIDIIRAFNNMEVEHSDLNIQRVAGMISQSGQYKTMISPTNKGNYYVFLDPNYELNENIKTTNLSIIELNTLLKTVNIVQVIIAFLTMVFIFLTFVNGCDSGQKHQRIAKEYRHK